MTCQSFSPFHSPVGQAVPAPQPQSSSSSLDLRSLRQDQRCGCLLEGMLCWKSQTLVPSHSPGNISTVGLLRGCFTRPRTSTWSPSGYSFKSFSTPGSKHLQVRRGETPRTRATPAVPQQMRTSAGWEAGGIVPLCRWDYKRESLGGTRTAKEKEKGSCIFWLKRKET